MSFFLISFLSGSLHIEGTVFQCEGLRLLCLHGKPVLGSMSYTSGLAQDNYRKLYKGISLIACGWWNRAEKLFFSPCPLFWTSSSVLPYLSQWYLVGVGRCHLDSLVMVPRGRLWPQDRADGACGNPVCAPPQVQVWDGFWPLPGTCSFYCLHMSRKSQPMWILSDCSGLRPCLEWQELGRRDLWEGQLRRPPEIRGPSAAPSRILTKPEVWLQKGPSWVIRVLISFVFPAPFLFLSFC